MANFGDLQNEIYLAGLSGQVPPHPMSFAELERRAELALPAGTWSYVAGGAGDEHTQRTNRTAFEHWGLVPRMLRASTDRDLSIQLFGTTFPTPVFLAPLGVIGICTQDGHGDLATARAAATTGVPMVASTLSQDPLEDVAGQFGTTPGFFQLYCPTDREVAASLVHRAEAAGYRAIVVTLDTWVTGWRPRDLATSNFPQLRGRCLATYFSDPVFRSRLSKPPEEDPGTAILTWAMIFGQPLTWDDLAWPPSTAWPTWPPRCRRRRSCSTPASARAPTWSKRSRSVPPRSGSAVPTPTAPRWRAPTASCTCSRRSWPRPIC
jgi:lactate 2-monooxygenase